jgi:enamine deaminase RidA (YjgF/YER057c/UK114 family)
MSKVSRTDPGTILSKAVEYHGFVYLQGVTAKDTSKDIKGQTADVLAQIDQLLETHGTDNTRLLQALIWVKNTVTDGMNEAGRPGCPGAPRLRVRPAGRRPTILVEIGDRLVGRNQHDDGRAGARQSNRRQHAIDTAFFRRATKTSE